jgi:hypothetical protein
MFGSDRSGLDAHLATIRGALRWRVLTAVFYAAGASAIALTALGFVLLELVRVGLFAVMTLQVAGAAIVGALLLRVAYLQVRGARWADLWTPEGSPVVLALRGDARGVTQLGAVRGSVSFVTIVLADGMRHDLPLAEEQVEPLYRFLQQHVRHATPIDLGSRR